MAEKPRYQGIDTWDTANILAAMNAEDAGVPAAVAAVLPDIAVAVERMVATIARGGHVHYFGAGTSGRLAVLDAYECPPTFGVDASIVQAHLAGGNAAFAGQMESAEDDVERGAEDARQANLSERDVAIGVAASGSTPYALGALRQAALMDAYTVALVCKPDGELTRIADLAIVVDVGPEVIEGSTRLKAGTAQKLVLNMLSSTTFIKLGHVYDGLMVAVRPENAKLRRRAVSIVSRVTGASAVSAERALAASGMDARVAIVALARGVAPDLARRRLAEASGNLRLALTT